jgi:hypothetical protein
MTKSEAKPPISAVNQLFANSPDGLHEIAEPMRRFWSRRRTGH